MGYNGVFVCEILYCVGFEFCWLGLWEGWGVVFGGSFWEVWGWRLGCVFLFLLWVLLVGCGVWGYCGLGSGRVESVVGLDFVFFS